MSVITNLGVAVISSLATALALVFAFVPRLIGFLVILLIGWAIAKGLEKGVTLLLRRVGFDRVGERIGLARMEQQLNMRMDASSLLGRVVFWFIFLIFLIPAFNALELVAVSGLLNGLISYVPNIFVAIVVLLLGMLVASLAYDVVVAASSRRMKNPRMLGNVVRYFIVGFSVLIALEQLSIAPLLISILFTAVVGGAALALGLSFGLGGRETAQRLLSRSESALSGSSTGALETDSQFSREPFNRAPEMGKMQSSQPESFSPSAQPGSSAQPAQPVTPAQSAQQASQQVPPEVRSAQRAGTMPPPERPFTGNITPPQMERPYPDR
ncbi:small-conductance mechanosensitive ion channel [Ktedonobacteria bacterium brp13]|nr:small-conductance mechanosensitive ion channel [Ktedonobacteria bacterium brp13]